jgi:hypothetical protein
LPLGSLYTIPDDGLNPYWIERKRVHDSNYKPAGLYNDTEDFIAASPNGTPPSHVIINDFSLHPLNESINVCAGRWMMYCVQAVRYGRGPCTFYRRRFFCLSDNNIDTLYATASFPPLLNDDKPYPVASILSSPYIAATIAASKSSLSSLAVHDAIALRLENDARRRDTYLSSFEGFDEDQLVASEGWNDVYDDDNDEVSNNFDEKRLFGNEKKANKAIMEARQRRHDDPREPDNNYIIVEWCPDRPCTLRTVTAARNMVQYWSFPSRDSERPIWEHAITHALSASSSSSSPAPLSDNMTVASKHMAGKTQIGMPSTIARELSRIIFDYFDD